MISHFCWTWVSISIKTFLIRFKFLTTMHRFSSTTIPIHSSWARVVAITAAIERVLLVCMLEFLIPFLKFLDVGGQLRIETTVSMVHALTSWTALCTPTSKVLLQGSVLLILLALHSIVGCVHTPMLLVEKTVLCICVMLLGNALAKRDHLFLGEVSCHCPSMIFIMSLVSWEDLFNFQCTLMLLELQYTLGHCCSCELILVLPVFWDHSQGLTHQVHVVKSLFS